MPVVVFDLFVASLRAGLESLGCMVHGTIRLVF